MIFLMCFTLSMISLSLAFDIPNFNDFTLPSQIDSYVKQVPNADLLKSQLAWELEKEMVKQIVKKEAKQVLNKQDITEKERTDTLKTIDGIVDQGFKDYENLPKEQKEVYKDLITNIYKVYQALNEDERIKLRKDVQYLQSLEQTQREHLFGKIKQNQSQYINSTKDTSYQQSVKVIKIFQYHIEDDRQSQILLKKQVASQKTPVSSISSISKQKQDSNNEKTSVTQPENKTPSKQSEINMTNQTENKIDDKSKNKTHIGDDKKIFNKDYKQRMETGTDDLQFYVPIAMFMSFVVSIIIIFGLWLQRRYNLQTKNTLQQEETFDSPNVIPVEAFVDIIQGSYSDTPKGIQNP